MNNSKFYLLTLLLILCSACSSSDDSNDDNDDCTKTIVVQAQQVVTGPTGTTVIPEVTQEVPCDFEDPVVISSKMQITTC